MIPVQTLRQLHTLTCLTLSKLKCEAVKIKSRMINSWIFVIIGLTLCSLSDGYIFGQMSGMINALRIDKTIILTEDDISLIASIMHITIFIGLATTGFLSEKYGRKNLIIFVCMFVIVHWLIVYFAEDKTTILISRIIGGLPFGGIIVVTYVNISEYVSPNIRAMALNMMSSVGPSLGTAAGHILCTGLHWRTVALIGIVPTIVSAILPFFWVESPYWLATKKKFDECEKAFRALHVSTEASEKELKMLIESQNPNINNKKRYNEFLEPIVKYCRLLKEKRYWRMTSLVLIVGVYRVVAGRVLINTFALSMLQDITGSTDILQYTLVVDGFMILGASMSCVLAKKFKMRQLLFTTGLISNCILIILATCIYLWPVNDSLMAWIKILLFAFYFIIIIAGPYAVLEPVTLELIPLDGKTVHIFVISGVFSILQFYYIHISIKMFPVIGYHGVFYIDGVIVFLCLIYCYFCLPETKNRSLQEIEYYFVKNSFKTCSDENVAEGEKLFKEDVESNVAIKLK